MKFEGYEMKNSEKDIRLIDSRPMSRRRFVTGITAGSACVGLGLGSGYLWRRQLIALGPRHLKEIRLT